jgi:hypothetical protein
MATEHSQVTNQVPGLLIVNDLTIEELEHTLHATRMHHAQLLQEFGEELTLKELELVRPEAHLEFMNNVLRNLRGAQIVFTVELDGTLLGFWCQPTRQSECVSWDYLWDAQLGIWFSRSNVFGFI